MRVLWYYHDFEYFARYSLDPVSSIHIPCAFVRTVTKDTAIDSQKTLYSSDKKVSYPYNISPIEIGLLWAKIICLKNVSISLDFSLQADMK